MKILHTYKCENRNCAISHLIFTYDYLEKVNPTSLSNKESSNECVEKIFITFNCH